MARVVAFMLMLGAAPQPLTAQTSEQVEQALWLKPRGEMEVEETRVIRFDAPVTRIVRDIPTPYPTIGVFVSAAFDDTRLVLDDDVDDRPAGAEVSRPRGVTRLQWRVAASPHSVHTFSVAYQIWNVLRQDDAGDYLEWPLTPLHPNGRIERATIRVVFSHALESPPLVAGGAEDVLVESTDRAVTVVTGQISRRRFLRLRLRFARNTAVGSGTRWQQLRHTRRNRAFVVFAGVVFALLTGAGWWAWRRAHLSANP